MYQWENRWKVLRKFPLVMIAQRLSDKVILTLLYRVTKCIPLTRETRRMPNPRVVPKFMWMNVWYSVKFYKSIHLVPTRRIMNTAKDHCNKLCWIVASILTFTVLPSTTTRYTLQYISIIIIIASIIFIITIQKSMRHKNR